MRLLLLTLALWTIIVSLDRAYGEPLAARAYRADLTREARAVWGLNAPVPVMAAQIHQESGWRPEVCSAYACGLTQFTSSTATWISGVYRSQLGTKDVFNPQWAIRALVLYDKHIYDRAPPAKTLLDRWAFTLSGYNGGSGWVNRDVRLCLANPPCDPLQWFGNVALWTRRAAWAKTETRAYAERILIRNQPIYAAWGPTIKRSYP